MAELPKKLEIKEYPKNKEIGFGYPDTSGKYLDNFALLVLVRWDSEEDKKFAYDLFNRYYAYQSQQQLIEQLGDVCKKAKSYISHYVDIKNMIKTYWSENTYQDYAQLKQALAAYEEYKKGQAGVVVQQKGK